jgi:cytochrome oxidase Cu insertion factor (SCO1/SenC/PrrC family)
MVTNLLRLKMARLLVTAALLITLFAATTRAQATQHSGEVGKPKAEAVTIKRLSSTTAARPSDTAFVKEIDAAGIKTLIGRGGHRDRPLLLFLWYTACEPCRSRLPDIERIYDEYHTRGLDVVIVSINPIDTKDALSLYLTKHRVRVPAYLLRKLDDELAEDIFLHDWEVIVPSAFFYNPEGQLMFAKTDLSGAYYEVLKGFADKVLATDHQ